jgi:hypothetical protein
MNCILQSHKYQNSVDCFDFVKLYYKDVFNFEIKINYLNIDSYKSIVNVIIDQKEHIDIWKKIKKPKDNCIVLLSQGKKMHHVGIWLNDGVYHFLNGFGLVYNDFVDLKRNGYKRMEFYKCLEM